MQALNGSSLPLSHFLQNGALAQLARALRWQRRGHRFDSDMLHKATSIEVAFLFSTNPKIVMKYFVYILYSEKCDRYYVGHSDNLDRRFDEHNSGRGGKYTARCKQWELVYTECYESRGSAVEREFEIKKRRAGNILKI